MKKDHDNFVKSGVNRTRVKEFNNCEYPSLIELEGDIINSVSVMALYLALGEGTSLLNFVEEITTGLDLQVNQSWRFLDNKIISLITKFNELTEEKEVKENERADIQASVTRLDEEIEKRTKTKEAIFQKDASGSFAIENKRSH